ncbi:MAG: biotin--[acetyl-CoA-carboxylase] ligase [Flavobacteriales bacterium]|nr:biotin--[acetyl-CoA-carboxylase] ligase [Flavobacteriales bacterium]
MKEKNTAEINIISLASTDSTSTYLLDEIKSGKNLPQYTVVSTECQSAGRGQGTNRWSSQDGKNLTFSLLLLPDVSATEHFYLNMCISLGITKALKKYISEVKIKWPNDIYVCGDKICGILIESSISGANITRSVVGVGLNVNQTQWEDWVPNPTSVRLHCHDDVDRNALLNEIVQCIQHYYSLLKKGEKEHLSIRYHQSMYLRGVCSTFEDKDGVFKGTITGVDDLGRLVIRDEGEKERIYNFKEVKYLK